MLRVNLSGGKIDEAGKSNNSSQSSNPGNRNPRPQSHPMLCGKGRPRTCGSRQAGAYRYISANGKII